MPYLCVIFADRLTLVKLNDYYYYLHSLRVNLPKDLKKLDLGDDWHFYQANDPKHKGLKCVFSCFIIASTFRKRRPKVLLCFGLNIFRKKHFFLEQFTVVETINAPNYSTDIGMDLS